MDEIGPDLELGFMQHLWAPWRSEYITHTQPERGDCLFCRVSSEANDVENMVAWRGRETLVMMNLYPYNSGHVMVVPYAHVSSPEGLTASAGNDLMAALQLTLGVLRRALVPHGFNLGANLGTVAGAGIADHFHLHVVPRWDGDTNFMPLLGETKVIPEHIRSTYQRLVGEFEVDLSS